MLVELLPLRPPSERWRANWVYWTRLFLSTMVLSFASGVSIVPASGHRLKHAVLVAICATTGYMLQTFVLARFWCFPVPFTILLATPVYQLSLVSSARLAAWAQDAQQFQAANKQIKAVIPLMQVQIALMAVYSCYNAVFLRLNSLNQVAFTLVLPAAKSLLIWLLARFGRGMPAASGWSFVSLKLFDALYLFKCMQSAGSTLSGISLISTDLLQNIHHVYQIHKHINHVRSLANGVASRDLIHKSIQRPALKTRSSQYAPHRSSSVAPRPPGSEPGDLSELDQSVEELVAKCEHVLVTEFIECAVPFFYSLYMIALFH